MRESSKYYSFTGESNGFKRERVSESSLLKIFGFEMKLIVQCVLILFYQQKWELVKTIYRNMQTTTNGRARDTTPCASIHHDTTMNRIREK